MIGTLKKVDDKFIIIHTKQGEDCDSVEVQRFDLPDNYPTDGLEDGSKIEFDIQPKRFINNHVLSVISNI